MAISLKAHRGGDHSQHGEEGVIRAIFEQIGAPTKTCVEFGAYDLEKLSNVYSLWTQGWRAVLIEGEPRATRSSCAITRRIRKPVNGE